MIENLQEDLLSQSDKLIKLLYFLYCQNCFILASSIAMLMKKIFSETGFFLEIYRHINVQSMTKVLRL